MTMGTRETGQPILISTSTPAGRSSRWSESTVLPVISTMSIRRLWIRISKCSRLSLSTWGERMTVYLRISVGNGTGPRTFACVRSTVSTIFFVDWSMTSWSYAFSRMRIFLPAAAIPSPLLVDLDDAAGADGAAAFTDREPQAFVHPGRLLAFEGHPGVSP